MSDAEHLIENAITALERYPYQEALRVFFETPINIMMAKDSGCPMNAVWEMAVYCDTTLRQDWKEKWEVEQYTNGRNDGIRAFAENLKDLIDEPRLIGCKNIDFVVDKINRLVKEKTEGQQYEP